MKSVICPISSEKVPAHLPRVTAFYVISLIVTYMLTGSLVIAAFLLYDFTMRGIGQPKLSLIHFLAKKTSQLLRLKSSHIDKAPKIFASRLGGLMFVIVLVSQVAGNFIFSAGVAGLVALLATFECAFNFCAGCYIYSYVVLPFYSD